MKFYFLILLLFFPTAVTLAAGISVSPEELDFKLLDNQPQNKAITVANPTADVQIFEVYPDDFTANIKTNPQSFTLESGAARKVTITVNPENLANAILNTNLSIVSNPLTQSRLAVKTGVKIPLTITQHAARRLDWIQIAGLAATILIIAARSYLAFNHKKTADNKSRII